MTTTTQILTDQTTVDRGVKVFQDGLVRRRFRRGLFAVLSSDHSRRYKVDIRSLVHKNDFLPIHCDCNAFKYTTKPCKHIVAATYAAISKGWI